MPPVLNLLRSDGVLRRADLCLRFCWNLRPNHGLSGAEHMSTMPPWPAARASFQGRVVLQSSVAMRSLFQARTCPETVWARAPLPSEAVGEFCKHQCPLASLGMILADGLCVLMLYVAKHRFRPQGVCTPQVPVCAPLVFLSAPFGSGLKSRSALVDLCLVGPSASTSD